MNTVKKFCLFALIAIIWVILWIPIELKASDTQPQDVQKMPGSTPHAKNTLVIGKVTDNPKKHYKSLKPIVDYAASHMKNLGITKGEVLMAKDNEQMVQYLKERKVDWVTETPFSAVVFEKEAGAEIILRKWKKGVPEYYTIFFTRRSSGIQSLDDLKGNVIAFEDPGSTTAFFVPASELIRHGLKLVRLESPRDKPPSDSVGYVFSGEEINSVTWVYRDLVKAAVFNNIDWEKDDHVDLEHRKELFIFHKTKPFPRALEIVRNDLNESVKSHLKQVLLKAHEDPKAKNALKAYQKTKLFDELDEQSLAGMDEVRSLLDIVQTELKE